jgi:bacterial/archaeal transporter family-2 protein
VKLLWIFIAFVAGTFLPIQAGLNTKMGKALQSPVHASMISFIVGVLTLIAYIFLTKEQVSWAGIRTAPAYVWIAGALGAFYVTAMILAFPKIGPALTFGLVVGGQMLMAVILDHFNLLVSQQHSVNIFRVLGILLIVAGVIIIRKF